MTIGLSKRALVGRARKGLRDFLFTPSLGYPLALLRMVIGYMVIFEGLLVFRNIDDLYGQLGYFQARLMEVVAGPTLPSLMSHLGMGEDSYSIFLRCFYCLHILLGLFLLLGYRTRAVSVGLWITQTLIVNSGHASVYGVHRYLHNLTFLAVWLPMAHVWSLDRFFSKESAKPISSCTWGLRVVQIFMLLTYVDAGTSKWVGSDWWSGEAVWAALTLPEFKQYNFYWLAQYPLIPKILSRATVLMESFYIIGYWIPVLGTAWAIGMIGMHLGIALFMGLTLFGTSLALVNAAIFLTPVDWSPHPRAVVILDAASPVRVLYFDGVCNLCNGFIDFLIKRKMVRPLMFSSLQGEDFSRNVGTSLKLDLTSLVLRDGTQLYLKSDAVLCVLSELGGLWCLVEVLFLVPRGARDFVYDRVAQNRYRWFGRRDTCRIPTPDERARFLV